MSRTTIELSIPHDPAERVRQQAEYDELSKIMDGLLALEMSARQTASSVSSSTDSKCSKQLAELYAHAAAGIAELMERRTIAVVHEADQKEARADALTRAGVRALCKDNERLRHSNAKLVASLEKMLRYFGAPVGVKLKDLGLDAYVDLPMKVRIGDLIDARSTLSHAIRSRSQTQEG